MVKNISMTQLLSEDTRRSTFPTMLLLDWTAFVLMLQVMLSIRFVVKTIVMTLASSGERRMSLLSTWCRKLFLGMTLVRTMAARMTSVTLVYCRLWCLVVDSGLIPLLVLMVMSLG